MTRELLQQLEAASISGDEGGLLSEALDSSRAGVESRAVFSSHLVSVKEDTTLSAVHDRLQAGVNPHFTAQHFAMGPRRAAGQM